MKILNKRELLLRLRNPEKVATVIENSKKVSEDEVIVNWGVDEVHALKQLNIKAPSPIEGR